MREREDELLLARAAASLARRRDKTRLRRGRIDKEGHEPRWVLRPVLAEAAPLGASLSAIRRDLAAVAAKDRALAGWEKLWPAVAGEDLARRTRPVSLRAGILLVEAESEALRAELEAFRARELLIRVQARSEGKKIRRLRFRAPGGED